MIRELILRHFKSTLWYLRIIVVSYPVEFQNSRSEDPSDEREL